MSVFACVRAWVIAFLLCVALPISAAEERLRLHGSNTIGQRLAPALVRAWAAERGFQVQDLPSKVAEEVAMQLVSGDTRISVEVHSHGTGTGLAGLLGGRADVWMASRPVKAEELTQARALGARYAAGQEHVIALDGLAIIVHRDNPLGSISVEQLRQIFGGQVRDWSRLGGARGAIRLYARDDKSGTFDSFKAMVLGDLPLDPGARRYESTDALAAAVAADPLGIGFVGMSAVAGGSAKAVAVFDSGTRAMSPTHLSVATEDYVLSRRLFFYQPAQRSPLARDFVEFVLGPEGQRIVEKIGFVSLDVRAYTMPPRDDVSPDYTELTRGARRLSLNFRFGSGQSWLDSRALRDLGRLVDYMRRDVDRREELILLGFVDGSESHPVVAVALANDRVDFVAHQLIERGVGATRVRGIGAMAPVANNVTEVGRARNRRVEVWVRDRPSSAASASASAGL